MQRFQDYIKLREDASLDLATRPRAGKLLKAMTTALEEAPEKVMEFLNNLAKNYPAIQSTLDEINHDKLNSVNKNNKVGVNSINSEDDFDMIAPNNADSAHGQI